MTKWGSCHEGKVGLTLENHCGLPVQQTRKGKPWDHLKELRKAFDKVQHSLLIKALSKTGIQESFLNVQRAPARNLRLTSDLMAGETHPMLSPCDQS